MAEQEPTSSSFESFALPYRPGEFQEVAERLGRLAESLTQHPSLGFITQEMRGAAAALARAEGLLGGPAAAAGLPVDAGGESDGEGLAAPEHAVETAEGAAGERGEWRGFVARQPEFDHVKGGTLRGWFFLAEHPNPNDREQTEWSRCYALGRHAEALQRKGRLAGAEVLVRGSFQGVRPRRRRDGTVVSEKSIYVYGVRVLRGPKPGPGQP